MAIRYSGCCYPNTETERSLSGCTNRYSLVGMGDNLTQVVSCSEPRIVVFKMLAPAAYVPSEDNKINIDHANLTFLPFSTIVS